MSISSNSAYRSQRYTDRALGFRVRAFHLGCTSLLALALAGCSLKQEATFNVPPANYQTRHPIIVDSSPTVLDIPAAQGKTHFSAGAESAITGFAIDYRRSGGKGISILVPSGSSNEQAARHLAGHARTLLKEAGVPGGHITTRTYAAQDSERPGHVRLKFSSIKARVASECGVWPTDVGIQRDNQNYENFGCSHQQNLAAIIADPNDLIAPRGPGEINPERIDTVISDFETNTVPTAPAVSTTGF